MNNSTSICTTCVNETNCMIMMQKMHPVWECSEFRYENKADTAEFVFLPQMKVDNGKETYKREGKGLCQDCELIHTCTWYRDDAVIFHCEHYQ